MSDQMELTWGPGPAALSKQGQTVLDYLRGNNRANSLTALEAIAKFGIGRLAAVICDLKKQGYRFASDRLSVTKADGSKSVVASYRLLYEPKVDGVYGGDPC